PRTEEEIAAKTIKDAIKFNNPVAVEKKLDVDEGFIIVGRKNRPVVSQARTVPVNNANDVAFKSGNYFPYSSQKQNGDRQGVNVNFVKHNNGNGVQKKNPGNKFVDNASKAVYDLGNMNVNEEFESKVWPELKEDVDILMEANPYCNDDEDVESDVEGIARDMKPEFEVSVADNLVINVAELDVVSSDI
ncbi:hypothetical protein Tco_1520761, partial [Tanacetum coccineum]